MATSLIGTTCQTSVGDVKALAAKLGPVFMQMLLCCFCQLPQAPSKTVQSDEVCKLITCLEAGGWAWI